MNNVIYSYVRDKKRRPIGVLLVIKQNEKFLLGWSKCHIELDKFDRVIALGLAKSRAYDSDNRNIPLQYVKPLAAFQKRCARYFKTEVKFS